MPYGQNCNVTDWRRTTEYGALSTVLKVEAKPIVSNDDCLRSYLGKISDDMMCAGVSKGGLGDSDGPMTIENVQLGVLS